MQDADSIEEERKRVPHLLIKKFGYLFIYFLLLCSEFIDFFLDLFVCLDFFSVPRFLLA